MGLIASQLAFGEAEDAVSIERSGAWDSCADTARSVARATSLPLNRLGKLSGDRRELGLPATNLPDAAALADPVQLRDSFVEMLPPCPRVRGGRYPAAARTAAWPRQNRDPVRVNGRSLRSIKHLQRGEIPRISHPLQLVETVGIEPTSAVA
jgi:hypothetical protein